MEGVNSRKTHLRQVGVDGNGARSGAFPIGLGQEGRGEPTVRITKLLGGLPRLPTAIQRAGDFFWELESIFID